MLADSEKTNRRFVCELVKKGANVIANCFVAYLVSREHSNLVRTVLCPLPRLSVQQPLIGVELWDASLHGSSDQLATDQPDCKPTMLCVAFFCASLVNFDQNCQQNSEVKGLKEFHKIKNNKTLEFTNFNLHYNNWLLLLHW